MFSMPAYWLYAKLLAEICDPADAARNARQCYKGLPPYRPYLHLSEIDGRREIMSLV
jgi:hypothetical protein